MTMEIRPIIFHNSHEEWYNRGIDTLGGFMTKVDYVLVLGAFFLFPALIYIWLGRRLLMALNRVLDNDIPNRIGFGIFCCCSLTIIYKLVCLG